MIQNFGIYRKPTQYEGVYTYEAPEGTHWESFGVNYGKIIWGGVDLMNPYVIVDDKDEDFSKEDI